VIDRKTIQHTSTEICKMLGINVRNITAVNLKLRPGQLPVAVVQHYVTGEVISTKFRLVADEAANREST
jgi:hypothetical protein